MKFYRLNRLFNVSSGRCLNVAMDHGFFGEFNFLSGIENLQSAIEVIVAAGPDAVQLTAGQGDYLQSIRGKYKPALVLRTDTANVYGQKLFPRSFSITIANPIDQALRMDAACVCINLFSIPGAPEVTEDCIRNIVHIMPESIRLGMPVMIEPLVFKPHETGGGYQVDGNLEKITALVRQAVELGADIIKTDPADDIRDYHKVVEAAGKVPVLVRGGGKTSDKEIMERTSLLMKQGISGIVYGRNIIQHEKPSDIIQRLMDIVHN
jgi:class I fructose-bisphosphate aldolase